MLIIFLLYKIIIRKFQYKNDEEFSLKILIHESNLKYSIVKKTKILIILYR